jgi:glycosidase
MERTKKITALLLAFLMLLGLPIISGCQKKELQPMLDPIDDNYRTYYQIFVGSFSDSNGDGIGDIRGIINRLDYLNDGNINSGKSLGVQGLWLSPIFSSPSYHKYDAKDYYKLDWRFGEEKDLVELINLCHERNVQIILDLAINHTSNQHEWFVKFKEARMNLDTENEYYDYYSCVTTEEKVGGVTYQKIAGVDCWYECNFSGDMPELNFDNPKVREAILDVAKYYLDLGVDGFRFDAIKYIYYGDTPKSVEFWEWYMSELRKIKPDIYCVGECWSGESEILEYYGAMNCFNFAMSQAEGFAAKAAKGTALSTYTGYVVSYLNKIKAKTPDGMAMSFLSNHDMDRIAGAFITENHMRMAANLYLLGAGSPVIYYGEEIGMRGSRGGENTDANRRLAMLWGDGDMIRDPIGTTYAKDKQIQTTVADQIEDENSMYHYYCRLIAIRHKYPAIARGDYGAVTTSHKNAGGFLITQGEETLLLLHNTSTEAITIDLSTCTGLGGNTFGVLADFIGVSDAKLEGTQLTIGAQTSVILK